MPRDGGGFAPKASPSTVVIDGGGSKEFARLDLPGGGSTVWSWPEALETPKVDGATATYAVDKGVDLLVTATALGVSTRIRINSAEATRSTSSFGQVAGNVRRPEVAADIIASYHDLRRAGAVVRIKAIWPAAELSS